VTVRTTAIILLYHNYDFADRLSACVLTLDQQQRYTSSREGARVAE
jgi:hypothetical protein